MNTPNSNPAAAKPTALSVTQLNDQVKQTLEGRFRNIWVAGEITDIARPHSGHIYLTLKDKQSQVRGVIWRSAAERLRFDLQDGQSVLCQGDVDVYGARGTYQLVIRRVELRGVGDLQFALRQLQQKLQAEGLFDPARKRPLPRFPRRIGLVTSPTSAAVHDFLEVAQRRWPDLNVLIIPTKVQGTEAAAEIVAGIDAAHRIQPALDVLVVARGGGSLEDLWCFNDERVVRAIAASQIPLVSAIGHEIDVTLSDLASDRRALTPSEAGELVVRSRDDLAKELAKLADDLRLRIFQKHATVQSQLEQLSRRPVFTRPFDRIAQQSQWFDEAELRFNRGIQQVVAKMRQQLASTAELLDAVGPLKVLARGYSVTQTADAGKLVQSVEQLQVGQSIQTVLADGIVHSTVDTLTENRDNAKG
ncbi:Exodeoxyribonuclease 7 large subunit [Rosistilla carotiformis]|uniref:Exodeoxyribonuclease 7 large subunit n=1 Tax=Rosistilla carotiformis TaxID=2528017 RepID=A0A518JXM6_9BACT|nr:exodeoxyribonuclease VII large subunit [Rosistilla carotiformis]QDV70297.1 Exodeoxyribonuclease 7 large subunit [Rosistilla carotiformis]